MVSAIPFAASRAQTTKDALPIGAEWQAERLRDSAVVVEGTPIRVENLHGDLRVRPAAGLTAEVTAVIQTRAGDPERPELRLVEEEGGGLTIAAGFVASDDPRVPEYEAIEPRRRIDLVVFLPEGSSLSARTDGGLLEVKGVTADLELETGSGSIVARSRGSIRARSDRGSVYVVLQGTLWSEPPAVETVSGEIRLEVPPSADARVVLLTAGEITTDFSIEIDRAVDARRKRAVARLGEASQEIVVTSQAGNVKLLEYPYPTRESAPEGKLSEPAIPKDEDSPEKGSHKEVS